MDHIDWIENNQSIGPLTENQFGEQYFFKLNRHDFDKVSAKVLFERRFSNQLFKEDSLNIIVGTDSGLLPRFLLEKGLPKGSRYIFIEPEPVLMALEANGMLDGLGERIVCISMQQWSQAISNFKVSDYFYIDAVRSFNAICAESDFIDEYAELSWHITEVLSQLHWQNSAELGMEAFITRQIQNIADNYLPAKLLENAFKGKTVVLLAGGPSLDHALSWVKINREHLLVFAVSRIARQLIAAHIEPDFVFSVDPTELSFDISKEMLGFSDNVTFICSYHTVPALLSQWTGKVFYLGPRLPWDSALNVGNLSSAGPTVTNTALSVAHQMGARQIILAGVDLCFTREGYTHASGSNEQLSGPRFDLTSLQVETNAGYLAPTSCDFAQAIVSLRLQVKNLAESGCKIINVSATAAKVEGIEFVTFSNIQLPSNQLNVIQVISDRLSGSKNIAEYHRNAFNELKQAEYQIKTIARLSERARQINDKMYNADGVIVNFKDKKELDQIEKKFKREHRYFSRLVKRFGVRSFIKLAKPFSDEEWTAEEAKQLGDVYYQAYSEGAQKLLTLVRDSMQRISARQQEYSKQPDFSLLVQQARNDKSFGRVRLWRKKFAAIDIPREMQEIFEEFEGKFAAVLSDQNTRHLGRAKGHSALSIVRQRAGLLFKHRKVEELNHLLTAIGKRENVDEALPYAQLVQGYLAELTEQPAEALNFYQKVVDGADVLLEPALVRIAAISIDQENVQMAELSLQCLTKLNPIFLPMYADLLRLNGELLAAIDEYATYINQFPQDSSVQMKLAMLYLDNNLFDGAELMLDYVLQNHPQMESALILKQRLSNIKLNTH